jgi:putative exporter of polyketide antibiotics
MNKTTTGRRIIAAATFSAAAILVAMVVQLVLALVLSADLSVWGLLSVTVTETADASSIGFGFSLVETLLLWLGLTALGSIRWGRQAGATDERLGGGARPQTR